MRTDEARRGTRKRESRSPAGRRLFCRDNRFRRLYIELGTALLRRTTGPSNARKGLRWPGSKAIYCGRYCWLVWRNEVIVCGRQLADVPVIESQTVRTRRVTGLNFKAPPGPFTQYSYFWGDNLVCLMLVAGSRTLSVNTSLASTRWLDRRKNLACSRSTRFSFALAFASGVYRLNIIQKKNV